MRQLALEVYLSQWRSAASHNMAASECETLPLVELLDMADAHDRQDWRGLQLGYTDPRGTHSLRETIASGYVSVTSNEILCFAGAQEGIHAAMLALLTTDDHAIVITPNYQSTETLASTLCAVTGVALDPTRGWTLDIDAVAAAIRPNTKLIAINFPNNPTGKILERDRFDQLAALCRRHGIWLFSDEIYRLIEHDQTTRLSAAVDVYERGISLGCVSKSYGLPGLRVGWIACRDSELLSALERAKHYLSNCIAAPGELLARIALKRGNAILARNRAIAATNLARLSKFFAAHKDIFLWQRPDGGVVGYPRYNGGDGGEAFCARLAEEHGVLLLPSSVYRSEISSLPENHFRIGFGRRDFLAGLAALEDGVRKQRACERRAG